MLFFLLLLLNFEKIITFTPNTTNIVFELGMESKLVGVSRHSKTTSKTKDIGDLTHWNYEEIIKLKPSITILLKEQKEEINRLKKLNIQTYQFDSDSIYSIEFEIKKIAKTIFNLEYPYKFTPAVITGFSLLNPNPKKTLVIVDRVPNSLKEIYVAGSDTFFNDFLPIWGGFNCYQKKGYKKISLEHIIKLNPDIIIDLTFNGDLSVWSRFSWKIINFNDISPLLQLSQATVQFILDNINIFYEK